MDKELRDEIYAEFGKVLGDNILAEMALGRSLDAAVQEVLSRYMP